MNHQAEFKGDWNIIKGKLKQKFALLTDNDLLLVEGKYFELLGRLKIKLGKTKEEVKKSLPNCKVILPFFKYSSAI